MGPDRFQIDQTNAVVHRVTKQVELSLTAEFVHQQLSEITFFALAAGGGGRNDSNRSIDIGGNVVLEFFVLPGKTARLLDAVAHA